MWLEKFIFCGKTIGPTNNNLKLAKNLAIGNPVPLGKHLLGSVYHLLHQVSSRLRKNQPITNLGVPWWFIQLWLHMYMHKTMTVELSEIEFLSENFSEEEETVTCRCTSFGEAVIMIANDPKTLGITDFFKSFYNGFPEISTIWFAYQDEKVMYDNPFKFQLDSLIDKINFIWRFIANLSGKIQPFSSLLKLKADQKFVWGEAQQKALDEIKQYLTSPPVLVPPQKHKPFRLYLSANEHAIGSALIQVFEKK